MPNESEAWRERALWLGGGASRLFLGQERAFRLLLIASMVRGHTLLEDGVGNSKATPLQSRCLEARNSSCQEHVVSYVDGIVAVVPAANKDALSCARGSSRQGVQGTRCALHGRVLGRRRAPRRCDFVLHDRQMPVGRNDVLLVAPRPSREVRNEAIPKTMADPRLHPDANPMPFGGKRMISAGSR